MVVIFFIEWRALYRVIVMVIFFVNNRKFALFVFKQNSWPPFNNDLGRKEKNYSFALFHICDDCDNRYIKNTFTYVSLSFLPKCWLTIFHVLVECTSTEPKNTDNSKNPVLSGSQFNF